MWMLSSKDGCGTPAFSFRLEISSAPACLARAPKGFDAVSGVEVWVAMHEDVAFHVRNSSGENIHQKQTAQSGIEFPRVATDNLGSRRAPMVGNFV
jgi:hypothetical protein